GWTSGRDPQLRGAWAFAWPALASLQRGRLVPATGPGDLRGDRSRHRLGRASVALRAGPRLRLPLTAVPGGPDRAGSRAVLEPRAVQAGTPAAPSGDPGGVYRVMADDCRTRGVPIIWVLIPRVGRPSDPAGHRALLEEAQAAKFTHIVDASD